MAQFVSLRTFIEHQGKVSSAIGAVDNLNEEGQNSAGSAQTARLSLFSSMLQDALVRDHIHVEDEEKFRSIEDFIDVNVHNNVALKADAQQIVQQNKLGEMLNEGHLADFNLSRMLWPMLLSQYDDAYRLDDEVVANASVHAQETIRHGDNMDVSESMVADPLKLYDVLQTLKMRTDS